MAAGPGELRQQGNAAFAAGDWEAAVERYSAALRACDALPDVAASELATLHSNRWVGACEGRTMGHVHLHIFCMLFTSPHFACCCDA